MVVVRRWSLEAVWSGPSNHVTLMGTGGASMAALRGGQHKLVPTQETASFACMLPFPVWICFVPHPYIARSGEKDVFQTALNPLFPCLAPT